MLFFSFSNVSAIDPCQENNGGCHENATCASIAPGKVNIQWSFLCVKSCDVFLCCAAIAVPLVFVQPFIVLFILCQWWVSQVFTAPRITPWSREIMYLYIRQMLLWIYINYSGMRNTCRSWSSSIHIFRCGRWSLYKLVISTMAFLSFCD